MNTTGLGDSILKLYRTVKSEENISFDIIVRNFSNLKIYEPLVHSSNLFGKMPTNRHILENEIEEHTF
jgi:hypothetical protein